MIEIIVETAPDAARLASLGVDHWPEWQKGNSEFRWEYFETETSYIVEGRAIITPEGGAPVEIVTATDWPERTPRFWLAYEFASTTHPHRLRVKVAVPEEDARVPSAVGLWPTADWLERETFDFYGIVFDGHPNLQRILLPDGWDGHPLRKTEELGGVNTRFKGAFIPPVDRRTS